MSFGSINVDITAIAEGTGPKEHELHGQVHAVSWRQGRQRGRGGRATRPPHGSCWLSGQR